MSYYLIQPGRGRVEDTDKFRTAVFAAIDCVDDVGLYIPLNESQVFIANIRASIRPDRDSEIMKLDVEHIASWEERYREAMIGKPADNSKWLCTAEQGAKLKAVVKSKILSTIKKSSTAKNDEWLQSSDVVSRSIFACFRPFISTGRKQYVTTAGCVTEALCELLQLDFSRLVPHHGFIARPASDGLHVLLPGSSDTSIPPKMPARSGYNDPLTLPTIHSLENDFNFIWSEIKSEWVAHTEYYQNPTRSEQHELEQDESMEIG